MTLGAFRFRPRWWGFALAACGCAAGIALGNWQTRRADERRAAAAEIEAAVGARAIAVGANSFDAAVLVRRRVAATGEFDPRHTVLLDYRLHRGRPGFHVVQPLRLAESGAYLLVLRGWIAAAPRREELPQIVTPTGRQRIEGIGLDHLPQYLEAGEAAPCVPGAAPCVWQNLSREKFSAWAGLAVAPLLIEQLNPLEDGLDRDWERVESGYRKNEMYALQWYSLAALSVLLFVALGFRRTLPSDGPGAA